MISHDLYWANHISKFVSNGSRRLGILRCIKSFLGTPELLSTYKPFICSLMEYCSPLLAGSPTSHLSLLDVVETTAFNIIGSSHDEAESMGLSLHPRSAFTTYAQR